MVGTDRIQAYNIGFYICLAIAIFGALLSVVLFFRLNVLEAYRMNSGKTKQSSIKKMREQRTESAPLPKAETLSAEMQTGKTSVGAKPPDILTTVLGGGPSVPEPQMGDATMVLAAPAAGDGATSVLAQTPAAGSPDMAAPAGNSPGGEAEIPFVITKTVMEIHTNEKI